MQADVNNIEKIHFFSADSPKAQKTKKGFLEKFKKIGIISDDFIK